MSKVAIAVLLPCILAAIVAAERNYTTLAGEYCSKFARLPESKCGWVPYEGFEYNATIDDTGCWDCGTGLVEMDGDDGPGILDPGDAGYFKEFFNFLVSKLLCATRERERDKSHFIDNSLSHNCC